MEDADWIRTEAVQALAAAQNAARHARLIEAQTRTAVAAWTAALQHARVRLESGRFELQQAQIALEDVKATFAARESEHTAAAHAAEHDPDDERRPGQRSAPPPAAQPAMTPRLQRAIAAREHARMQVRFAVLRTTAAKDEVTTAEGMLKRCQKGVEQAGELLRSCQQPLQHAEAALALAREGVSLADAAVTQSVRGKSVAEQASGSTREAHTAVGALSEQLGQAQAAAQGVREAREAHEAQHQRGVAALERAHAELLEIAAAAGA
jgi:hypothetical protein